jgi:ABC-type branched-subunit amino acid transport system substrate-binding protein
MRTTTAKRRVTRGGVALALTAAVGLAACSSSSKSTSSNTTTGSSSNTTTGSSSNSVGSASSGSAAANGSPIKVMMIGTISSEAFSFPETVNAAQAYADVTNAAGGINGHKIEILTCNDQIDPAVAAACGRKAVADHVSAVLAIETDYQPQVIQAIAPAHMAYIGNNAGNPQDLTASNSFDLGAGSYGVFASMGTALVQNEGCKKVSVVDLNIPATEISGRNIKASVQTAGGSVTNIATIPATLASYSSIVSTAIDDGAGCIATVLGPSQILALIAAIHSSSKPDLLLGATSGLFTQKEFDQVKGEIGGDVFTTFTYALPTAQVAGSPPSNLQPFLSAMQKYEPTAAVDLASLQGWDDMTMFVAAAQKAKSYDAASILAAMGTVKGLTLAGFPDVQDFTTPNPNPQMSRVVDPNVLVYKLENGLFHLLPGEINVNQGLGAFLKQEGS